MSKLSRRLAGILAASAMLASCAQHNAGQPALTQIDGQACAGTPDFAQATPLVFDPKQEKSIDADIGPSAHCILTGGKPALYSAFALPASSDPYIVTVMAMPLSRRRTECPLPFPC